MTGRREAVGAHSAIITFLVGGLAGGRKTHNHVSRTNVGIINHIAAFHSAGDCRVDNDGSHQVAHVGRLASCWIDTDSHLAHLGQEIVSSVDDGRYHLTGNEHLVASDGRADEDVIHRTHAKQVVGVHHDGVLCDSFPNREVARLFPIHIRQRRFRSGSVCMHDVAILWVTAQDVGDDFAEGLWKNAFVNILDGVVYVFFGGAHTAHHVSVVAHFVLVTDFVVLFLCIMPKLP